MQLSSPWIPRLEGPPGTACDRLVRALATDIVTGAVPPGARLPAHRDLAWRLDIALGTVTKAFGILERRGLVRGVNGRGTFVAGEPSRDPARIDLSANVPPRMLSDRLLAAGLNSIAKRLDAGTFSSYAPPNGREDHRRLLARWLAEQGMPCSSEEVLICNGAQHALSIAFAVACEPGSILLTEALTYPGALMIARRRGVRVVGVSMDEQGLSPDALADALAGGADVRRVLYLTPTLQNPTGADMGAGRRREIVRLCRRHDVLVVEDDVHSAFRGEGVVPIAALAPERTLLVTGLSKALSPGLRIGCLVTPKDFLQSALTELRASATSAPLLSCLIMADWLADGTARHVADAIVEESARRFEMARKALPGLAPSPRSGFHVWRPMDLAGAEEIHRVAAREGVILPAPREFMAEEGQQRSGVRISLGAPSLAELRRGLDVLAIAFAAGRDRGMPA